MRSPVRIWSAAPEKATTFVVAFFASVAAKPPHHLGHMRPVAHGQDIAVIVVGVGESIEGAAFDIVPEGKTLRYILLNNHVKGEKPQNNYGNKCNLRNTQFPRLCL